MDSRKKQIVEQLWKLVIKKITEDWDKKYKEFGDAHKIQKIDKPHNFAGAVLTDIESDFKRRSIKYDPVSQHTLNRIFQQGRLSENTKSGALDMFACYVGFEDWDDFWLYSLKNLTIDNSSEIDDVKDLDHSAKQFFIYYYIDTSFKPDKSLLIITNNTAQLITFHTDSPDNKHPKTLYEGEVTNSKPDEIAIYFTKEKRGDKDYLTANPSFCCFENTSNDRKLGVFAATGKTISCGMVVIEKTSYDEYMSKINGSYIPPAIHSIIYNARLFPTGYYHKGDFLDKKTSIINTAKNYKGTYEGFTIISQGVLSIQRFALEIFDSGDVRFKSNGRPEGEFGRIIDVRKGKNLVMQFSLNKLHNYYKTQIVLDLLNNKVNSEAGSPIKALIGIYGGITETSESPMAGRVLLYPTEKKYEEMQCELIAVSDEQKIKHLFDVKKPLGRILRKFFRGELDEYVDPPFLLEKCKILSYQ